MMQKLRNFFGRIDLRDVTRVYRAFVPHLGKYWKRFLLAYLALFAAMVMNLLKPWPLKIIIDYILLNKDMPSGMRFISSVAAHDKLILLAISCVGIVAIFFLESLFTFSRKYFMEGTGEKTINDIRQEVFGHLQMLEHRTDR